MIVEAKADGEKLALLLDTGNAAPFDMLLTDAAVARLKGEPAPPPTQTAGPVQMAVIAPQTIRKFRLGPVKLRNASAGTSPAIASVAQMLGRPVDGILGYRFLKGRTVSVDYRTKRVDLEAEAPAAGTPIGFTVGATYPLSIVRVTVNGKGPFTFAMDTGSTASLISPAAAKAAELGEGRSVNLGGVGGADAGGGKLVQATLAIDGFTRANRNVAVTGKTAAIGRAAGIALDGVLGADFFADTRVVFDYAANRMWIDAPATDAAVPAGVER